MKQFYFILFSTFFIGVLSGVYVYFISQPSEPLFDFGGNNEAITRGFEIIATAYGGCQMLGDCPSYRIGDDASYRYLISSRTGSDELYEGMLSSSDFTALKRALSGINFEAVEQSTFSGSCPAAYDGPAYIFEIIIGGERYIIDTCEQDTEDTRLFPVLEEYFISFEETHRDF